MKATTLDKYRIPARQIAEMAWGTRGTHSYRCNRAGAYYFSCSAHGGYVVDARCLTPQELRKIKKYAEPLNIRLLIQQREKGEVIIGASLLDFRTCGRRLRTGYRLRYYPGLGPVRWQDLPVFLFEEDCGWAILEKLTDIRAEGCTANEAQRRRDINNIWENYIKPRRQHAEETAE